MEEACPFEISQQGISNGLLRLNVGPIFQLIPNCPTLYLKDLKFKLEYKTIIKSTESEWKSTEFSGSYYVQTKPMLHFNVRLANNLYDYEMKLKVSLMIHESAQANHALLPKNKWFAPSDIIDITVPSLMKEQCYNINDWIKFKKSTNDPWIIGIITDKVRKPNIADKEMKEIDKYHYKIILSSNASYEPFETTDTTVFKDFYVHSYVDMSNRSEADKTLLIGNRLDINNNADAYVLFEILTDIYHEEYAMKYMKGIYFYPVDFISIGKNMAFNIIDFLWDKDKGYKVWCPMMGNHYNAVLRMKGLRDNTISAAFECKQPHEAQQFHYYCDVCLCRMGDYDWVYKCEIVKGIKYDGNHDVCVTCVYDMIKRCDQLSVLMQELLRDTLSMDCIQVIVMFTGGNVVQL